MAQTNVNIRMDEETKKAFDAFCAEIGISVSAAFNIFAKTVVREQRIPFALSARKPDAETARGVQPAAQKGAPHAGERPAERRYVKKISKKH